MTTFYPLIVNEVRTETDTCVSVCLDVPSDLQAQFVFVQGQYLTFKTQINGAEVRRSYSICSAPHEGELRVAIKLLEGGAFSTYANKQLKVGDVLETLPPMGRFYTTLHPEQAKSYFLVAAGSGITPILSLLKTILKTEPNSEVTLVYGNKDRNSIIFKEEIEGLKNKFMERMRVYHILSREFTDAPLFQGRIDADKCQHLFRTLVNPSEIQEAFICGPEEMIHAVRQSLETAGVPKSAIHFELFATTRPASIPQPKQPDKVGKSSKVTIILDGRTMVIDLPFGTDNILDAALKQGADLPFACKGGVCCTCRAKLTEGEVEMAINYALEPEETAQGFVLTCQSYPQTDSVTVNFDVK